MPSCTLYKIGRSIAVRLPIKAGYALAIGVSKIHQFFHPEDRIAVLQNLRVIFPGKPEEELRRIQKKLSVNFAKYLVDFFRFHLIDQDFLKKQVKLLNMKNFDMGPRDGRGTVILTAHLGNWELGGVVIALCGYPFWVVALAHKNPKVNDFFNNQRNSKGIKVIQVGKAVKSCLSLLKQGKMVALVGDRDFSRESGIIVNFFGKPTYFPKGPATLALKTGSLITPGFLIRNSDDTFTMKIEKPIDCNQIMSEENLSFEQMVQKLTETYKDIFEEYIRRYPDQWYMFRKFWIE